MPNGSNLSKQRTCWYGHLGQTLHNQKARRVDPRHRLIPVAAWISADQHAIRDQVDDPELPDPRPGVEFPLGPQVHVRLESPPSMIRMISPAPDARPDSRRQGRLTRTMSGCGSVPPSNWTGFCTLTRPAQKQQ